MKTTNPVKKVTTVENAIKFSFRVPEDIYKILESEAVKNGRSINSQLIQVLKDRYPAQHPTQQPQPTH